MRMKTRMKSQFLFYKKVDDAEAYDDGGCDETMTMMAMAMVMPMGTTTVTTTMTMMAICFYPCAKK